MPQLPPPAKKVSEDLLQMEKNSDRRRSAICFVFNDEGVRRYLSRNKETQLSPYMRSLRDNSCSPTSIATAAKVVRQNEVELFF